jgi:hypothetical protein
MIFLLPKNKTILEKLIWYYKIKAKLDHYLIMIKHIISSLNIYLPYKKYNKKDLKAMLKINLIPNMMIRNGKKKVINIFFNISKEYCFNILLINVQDLLKNYSNKLILIKYLNHMVIMPLV